MKASRKRTKKGDWPRKVSFGRFSVSVYRRKLTNGRYGFQLANYASGKRRLDSYPTEGKVIEAAHRLARQLSERQVVAASLTNAQAAEYVSASQALQPHNVNLPIAADTLAKCLDEVGDLPSLLGAVKFYTARNRRITRKRVEDIVCELIDVKRSRQVSDCYIKDLHHRLGRFGAAFQKDICDVTTPELQAWMDNLNLSTTSYQNFRRQVLMLFKFAVARGYAADNPCEGVESIKVRRGEILIYTPAEIRGLLEVASVEFVPFLVLGAFAGLRSAEIERLVWTDIRLEARHVVIDREKAKTASRRIVPMTDNLAAWLAPYAGQDGKVWPLGHEALYTTQRETSALAGFKWKKNALRHSYASYRFALTTDAGRVAGEMGNSHQIVHSNYRELVTPADAERWFAAMPTPDAANILPMPARK